jgi:lipoprotein signal peptidase
MTRTAYRTITVPSAGSDDTSVDRRRRQGAMTLGLLVAVVVLDQATKWWGWRHAPKAFVNTGSTWFLGGPVSGWVSGPVTGPLIDLMGLGLVSVAGSILVRRRRQHLFLVAGVLMISGWGSNLLDRLGMHAVTAPGSDRGAIDFIPLGPVSFNLADVVITVGTVLYLVAAITGVRRSLVVEVAPPLFATLGMPSDGRVTPGAHRPRRHHRRAPRPPARARRNEPLGRRPLRGTARQLIGPRRTTVT